MDPKVSFTVWLELSSTIPFLAGSLCLLARPPSVLLGNGVDIFQYHMPRVQNGPLPLTLIKPTTAIRMMAQAKDPAKSSHGKPVHAQKQVQAHAETCQEGCKRHGQVLSQIIDAPGKVSKQLDTTWGM